MRDPIIHVEICTSDATTAWVTCAGYREHVTFKGADKAKRCARWAAFVRGEKPLAEHLINIGAADLHCGATAQRLSPSFFATLAEESLRPARRTWDDATQRELTVCAEEHLPPQSGPGRRTFASLRASLAAANPSASWLAEVAA